MKVEMDAKMVTVYVNSTDQWRGRPLYSAIVSLCQEMGIAGATVLRCVEGYGAGRQLHTTRLLELSENLPLHIEIVDLPERIEPLLVALGGMIGEGLVTVADVHILRFLPDPKHP
jgi:PII-like signaling protein